MTSRTFAQNGSLSLIVMALICNLDFVFPRFSMIQVFIDNNFDLDQFLGWPVQQRCSWEFISAIFEYAREVHIFDIFKNKQV